MTCFCSSYNYETLDVTIQVHWKEKWKNATHTSNRGTVEIAPGETASAIIKPTCKRQPITSTSTTLLVIWLEVFRAAIMYNTSNIWFVYTHSKCNCCQHHKNLIHNKWPEQFLVFVRCKESKAINVFVHEYLNQLVWCCSCSTAHLAMVYGSTNT